MDSNEAKARTRPSKRRWARGSFRLLVSLCISLALLEALLRIFTPPAFLLDHRTDAYWRALARDSSLAALAGSDVVDDPVLGWRMRPNYDRGGVHHNSRGYRGVREYAEDPGVARILAIGDSYTYGLGVRDDSTWAAQLERIAGVEVVNAGVNGYGLDQALLMWETEGRRLHPTVVVLGYFFDDFLRNGLSIRDASKPRFVWDEGMKTYRLEPLGAGSFRGADDRSGAVFGAPWRLVAAARFLSRRTRVALGDVEDEVLRRDAGLSDFLLRRLASSVADSGARLVVVVFGYRAERNPELDWITESILEDCTAIGIECIDLAAAVRDVDSASFFAGNTHFSELGNRFAAERIAEVLAP